jgi:hypothetical protein
MVQAMEAWFHADKEKIREYYGRGFRLALRPRPDIDNIQGPTYLLACKAPSCLKVNTQGRIHSTGSSVELTHQKLLRASSPCR